MLGRRRLAAVLAGTALAVGGIATAPADAAEETSDFTLRWNGFGGSGYHSFALTGIDPAESVSVHPGATLTVMAPPQVTLSQAAVRFDIDPGRSGPLRSLDAAALSQSIAPDGTSLTLVLPSSVAYPAGRGWLYLEGAAFTGARASFRPMALTRWTTRVVTGGPAEATLPLRTEIRLPFGDSDRQYVTPGRRITLRLPTGDSTQTALGDPDLQGARVDILRTAYEADSVLEYPDADLAVEIAPDHRSLSFVVPQRIRTTVGHELRVTTTAEDVSVLEWRTNLNLRRAVEATRVGVMRVDAAGRAVFHLSTALPAAGGTVAAERSIAFGRKGDVPFAGDWDGDGTATVGVFRPSNGTWYLAGRNVAGGAPVTVVPFGRVGDRPVVGRFGNDERRTSIGVLRDGTFLLARTPTAGSAATKVRFGRNGDLPLAGDRDGDGLDDLSVYRPSSRRFLFPDGSAYGFGRSGDVPLLQDHTFRGSADLGLFRPSTATFLFDVPYRFGRAGDVPFTFTP